MLNNLLAIIIFVVTAFIIYYRYAQVRAAKNHQPLTPPMPIAPNTTIIVFDIHGVLFKADYKNIIKTFLKSPDKCTFIRHALYPSIWLDFIRLWRNSAVFGKYVAHFTHQYPTLHRCVPLITDLANTQTPIPETIALIHQLHADGYTLHIFSNIGKPVMEDLAYKFPSVFSHFDAIKTPSADNNFTGKPDPSIFDEYMHEHKGTGKQILFIDDKIKNLEIAKRFGITGIYFKDPKKLRDQLTSFGLCVAE